MFLTLPMMKILFACSGMWARLEISVAMLKPVKAKMNVRNDRKVILKMKSSYVTLYVINGTIKTVFMSNLSHPVILLDYVNGLRHERVNRLYYLMITGYIYD